MGVNMGTGSAEFMDEYGYEDFVDEMARSGLSMDNIRAKVRRRLSELDLSRERIDDFMTGFISDVLLRRYPKGQTT